MSLHNYLRQFSPQTITAINETYAQWSRDPSQLSIPEVVPEFFDQWLDTDGYGCCDLFDVVRSWWKLRNEPNVLLVHYQQLKDDLGRQIVRIARFLDVDPAILQMDAILVHCSFEYMRTRSDQMAPFGGAHLIDPNVFFDQGPRRNYQTKLTAERIARFDRMADEKLESACVRWLEHGSAYVEG
jgi:aryl sulfotransferase